MLKQLRKYICSENCIRKMFCAGCCIIFITCFSSDGSSVNSGPKDTGLTNDGPYIFLEEDILRIKWIENSQLKEEELTWSNFDDFKDKFSLLNNFNDLRYSFIASPKYRQSYSKEDSIAVITDIHGEYDIYLNLLKKNGIVDDNLNWKFGKGHLVILGDIFDRGDNVTEVLWHLYGLERQASKAGGKLHLLLGNHELMILGRATSYISGKYRNVENILGTYYCDLYSENSVLGSWLRTRPVIISINNILFVHAGLSTDVIRRDLKLEKINRIFSTQIIGKEPLLLKKGEEASFLFDEEGPVWYRGYFTDKGFCESQADSILTFFEKDHIVIGHTVTKEIMTFFGDKIIACDAGIMYRKPGEMLINNKGRFYRCTADGKRIPLN